MTDRPKVYSFPTPTLHLEIMPIDVEKELGEYLRFQEWLARRIIEAFAVRFEGD